MPLPRFQSLLFCTLAAGLLGGGVAQASPRQLSDLSNRSAVEDVRFDMKTKTFDMNNGLQGKRVEFGQWHSSFSNLGSKRAGVSMDVNQNFADKALTYEKVAHKDAGIAVESSTRKMAQFRNVDQVRDIVIATQFEKTSNISVEGKAFQEMVDEMSLKDINRFQAFHNKTDQGIPQVQAGSTEAPTLRPKSSAE